MPLGDPRFSIFFGKISARTESISEGLYYVRPPWVKMWGIAPYPLDEKLNYGAQEYPEPYSPLSTGSKRQSQSASTSLHLL